MQVYVMRDKQDKKIKTVLVGPDGADLEAMKAKFEAKYGITDPVGCANGDGFAGGTAWECFLSYLKQEYGLSEVSHSDVALQE